jgi:hypothetical protein
MDMDSVFDFVRQVVLYVGCLAVGVTLLAFATGMAG